MKAKTFKGELTKLKIERAFEVLSEIVCFLTIMFWFGGVI